jgi:hypothetical protein
MEDDKRHDTDLKKKLFLTSIQAILKKNNVYKEIFAHLCMMIKE